MRAKFFILQNYLDLLTNEKPDERQIMTYVSCYYHAFQGAMQVLSLSCDSLENAKNVSTRGIHDNPRITFFYVVCLCLYLLYVFLKCLII